MSVSQPRLCVFAGPNGSGKSTLKEVLPESLLFKAAMWDAFEGGDVD